MRNDQFTAELHAIFRVAREVATAWGHASIHAEHLFSAMLQQPECTAAPYLKAINRDTWEAFMRPRHKAGDPITRNGLMAMTISAERVLIHAATFSFEQHQPLTDSLAVLLAMMAYDNPIKSEVHKTGWLQKHIIQDHYGPAVTFPALLLKDRQPISKLGWLLMSKAKKDAWLERQYRDALILKDYHMHEEVKKICNKALTTSQKPDTRFYQLLALSAFRQRDFDYMESILTHLTSLPDWCEHLRAETAVLKGDFVPRLELMERCIINDPDNALFLNNIGYYRSLQENYTAALPYFERAIRADPAYPLPHGNMGFCLYKLGKVQEGILSIQHAIELDKSLPFTYKHLGVIYMETGDKVRAKEQFELALKYDFTFTDGDEVIRLLAQLNGE